MAEPIAATLARLESQVSWWRDQAQQVERDRANLRWVVPAGAGFGALVALWYPGYGAALFGLTCVIWMMGLYMTTVRRTEFRDNLAEAQAALKALQIDRHGQEPHAVAGATPTDP
jgi:hypothetical protein